jgi:hypothetical protein
MRVSSSARVVDQFFVDERAVRGECVVIGAGRVGHTET